MPSADADLRTTLLRATAQVVAESGVGEVSVRALARAAGVSHAAHRHHFASRTGLLTALAAEGHRLLAAALEEATATSFLEAGVAYVGFAHDHPGHFAVMFTPDALDGEDPELVAARARTFGVLSAGVESLAAQGRVEDARAAVVAAWSLVHGLATLAATGNLSGAGLAPPPGREALLDLARRAAGMLFGSPSGGTGDA
ncbi:TetR/AcrR family transcriptional regulator [Blastococcus deserti]|uniref:TetR/AcrR family transcriptional regulator n=1 Tax=Blastococcus deserti TaxID=2259033 RepID=A0ABW4X877_9ACTN